MTHVQGNDWNVEVHSTNSYI